MEGLDSLIADLCVKSSAESERLNQRIERQSSSDLSKTESSTIHKNISHHQNNENISSTTTTDQAVNDKVLRVENALKSYILNLADGEIRNNINAELSKISYNQFLEYYLKTDKLALYTIEKEINRMNFSITKDNIIYTETDLILMLYDKFPLADEWRFMNQSIYSDILQALQHHFIIPELSISVISTISSFHVNFDLHLVKAESEFSFVTLKGDVNHSRLKLGTTLGTVDIDFIRQTLVQNIALPQMQVVFDDDIRKSSIAVASLLDDNFDFSLLENKKNKLNGLFTSIFNGIQSRVKNQINNMTSIKTDPSSQIVPPTKTNNNNNNSTDMIKKFDGITNGLILKFGQIIGADKSENGMVDNSFYRPSENVNDGFISLLDKLKPTTGSVSKNITTSTGNNNTSIIQSEFNKDMDSNISINNQEGEGGGFADILKGLKPSKIDYNKDTSTSNFGSEDNINSYVDNNDVHINNNNNMNHQQDVLNQESNTTITNDTILDTNNVENKNKNDGDDEWEWE